MKDFQVSDPVWVRSYNTPGKWVQGEVLRKIGNMHYDVYVSGRVVKRRIDQLRPTCGIKTSDVIVEHGSDEPPSEHRDEIHAPTTTTCSD